MTVGRGFAPLVAGIALALVGVAWGARVYVAGAYTVQTAQVLSMGALMLLLFMVTPKKSAAIAPAYEVAYEEPASVVASEPVSESSSWMDRARSDDQPDTSFTPESEMPAFAARSRFNPDVELEDKIFGEQGQAAHA